jgi:hypothetical protein
MQCAEFETRLNQALDERVSPERDDQLVEHARQCAACRSLRDAMQAIVEGLDRLAVPPASADLAERVLGEFLPRRVLRFPLAHRRVAWAAAVAASLVVAVGVWWSQRTPVPGPVAKVHHAPPRTGQPPVEGVTELARETRQRLAGALLMVPSGLGVSSDEREPREPNADPRWDQQIGEGFAPLTRSTADAFQSLWQVLPLATEDPHS